MASQSYIVWFLCSAVGELISAVVLS